MALIELDSIHRAYPMGTHTVRALDGVTVHIERGEAVALMGPSGSGKSAMLHLLGCLDQPSSGTYRINGEPVSSLSPDRLAKVRRHTFGFVFQSFHLIPRLTAAENIELPMTFAGTPPSERRRRVQSALEAVGLTDRSDHRPDQLSGGQRQRTAIARAIVLDPEILLADEPTGNLDTKTGEEILALLLDLHRRGKTLIVVTHNPEVAGRLPRVIRMVDGRVARDERT